jgi:exosortase/archaeosortase family protein
MQKAINGKYVLTYAIIFSLVLIIFYVIPSGWAEVFTAAASAASLDLLSLKASWWMDMGITYIQLIGARTVVVSVIRECTALNVLGVIAGLVLPLQASLSKRLIASLTAGIALFALNIPRIALTIYLTAFDIWPFTLLPERSLETYHYPISFGFGVVGVALVVLGLSRWIIPELGDTLVNIIDWAIGSFRSIQVKNGD